MKYTTVVAVVPEGEESGVIDALRHHDGVRFAGSREGVTQDALDAGAEPTDWGEADEPFSPESLAERYRVLPFTAQQVLSVCLEEIEANRDHSDSNTARDLAADIQRKLGHDYLGQE